MEWFMETIQEADGTQIHSAVLTEDEVKEKLRLIREQFFTESDLWMLPDRYEALSSEQQTELLEWRQMLRDLPASDDPYNPTWIDKPTWME